MKNLQTLYGIIVTIGFIPIIWAGINDYEFLVFLMLGIQFVVFILFLNQNSKL